MTTTANRPSLARKQTPKSEAARKAALDEGVKISYDGEEYVIMVGDVTSTIARRFRREVGFPFMMMIGELETAPDIDSVAALVWLARLLRGEDVSLDEVEMVYGDLDKIEVSEPGPGDDVDPEA